MESVNVFKTGDNANTEPSITTLLLRSSNPGKRTKILIESFKLNELLTKADDFLK